MLKQMRFLTHVLGRRETLKYLSIAAVGAAIAPLTGCSGSTQAFKAFAAGTWNVTCPTDEPDLTITLTVDEGGAWSADVKYSDMTASTNGTWSLNGGNLTVTEQESDSTLFLHQDGTGVAFTIPDEVDQNEMIASFQWSYGYDGLEVPVAWDKDSQTLTLTGTSSNNDVPMPIVAVKE